MSKQNIEDLDKLLAYLDRLADEELARVDEICRIKWQAERDREQQLETLENN